MTLKEYLGNEIKKVFNTIKRRYAQLNGSTSNLFKVKDPTDFTTTTDTDKAITKGWAKNNLAYKYGSASNKFSADDPSDYNTTGDDDKVITKGWAKNNLKSSTVYHAQIQFSDKDYSSTSGDITSLVNMENDIVKVTNNKDIVFKIGGIYLVSLSINSNASKVDDTTRVKRVGGASTVVQPTRDSSWNLTKIPMEVITVNAGDSISFYYWAGKFSTDSDTSRSFVTIAYFGKN